MHERSREHYAENMEDSHMSKHWSEAHMPGERPSFNQYVVSKHKSCLDQQLGEAVRLIWGEKMTPVTDTTEFLYSSGKVTTIKL